MLLVYAQHSQQCVLIYPTLFATWEEAELQPVVKAISGPEWQQRSQTEFFFGEIYIADQNSPVNHLWLLTLNHAS